MTIAKALLLASVAGLALGACAPSPRPGPPPSPVQAQPEAGAPVPQEEGVVLRGPEGSEWVKPGVTSARYRADVESCYSYAQAQIAHDVRIESDSSAAFETFPSGLGITELRGRMREFERTNRRPILFTNCMVAKGYSRR
ncbi:MAG: hypothetical protein ACE5GS_03300 [Kiloniellaceae bacterium]